ncbi:MAG TPA: AmmeMemoRadiSam system protein A [Thermoanaerobaculia bacterium]|nr:AmmeMemoRadiSam system protein A [Thermoanaerobaculia bacterium]
MRGVREVVEPLAAPDAAARGRLLLALARAAIEEALGAGRGAVCDEPWLREPGACFVTLRLDGLLRGCVGSVRAVRPLGEDVRANARAAALDDPRFPPLRAAELTGLAVELSLLSPLEPLPAATEEALLAALRPGADGVVLEVGSFRATFLPQVWEQVPEPRQFLAALKQKAGVPQGWWGSGARAWRYGVTKWSE